MGSPATSALFSCVQAGYTFFHLLPALQTSPSIARIRRASSLFFCEEIIDLSALCSTPVYHGMSPSFLAAEDQRILSTPELCQLSSQIRV